MKNYLHAIILYMINKFEGERSIYAIYHMLQGKKSSQTIQDAHLFRLTSLFGILPRFTRQQLDQTIELFLKEGYIAHTEKTDAYTISAHGRLMLQKHFEKYPFPTFLNGWKYQDISPAFWGRLNLFIQTISHIVHKEKRFYPIQQSVKIQQYIKDLLYTNREDRTMMGRQLFAELSDLLQLQEPLNRDVFVMRLTGVNRIGLTFEQIAKQLETEEEYVRIVFLESLHHILSVLETSRDYPLLASLLNDWKKKGQSHLTQSTQMTLGYLKTGKSLDEIAAIRRLKTSTIEDHLVEIVLADKSFPIGNYVSKEDEADIVKCIRELKTRQLKAIKRTVKNDQVSFFQIRLVLAKEGDGNEY